jgi:hypothetical protein
MMSLTKAVPEGIKDRECKRITFCKRPPVLYVPKKDIVQEIASAFKNDQSLKTSIEEDAELCLPIWHCVMHESFLMHVSMAPDAIKTQVHIKAYT